MKPISVSQQAQQYVERFGMSLVPIEPGQKFPAEKNWGNKVIADSGRAEQFYSAHPDWNMGLALGPSAFCSLDIDCLESFKVILREYGIVDEDLKDIPTIQGSPKGKRLMFKVPQGTELPYCKLNWPSKLDPTGDIHRQMMADALAAKRAGETVKAADIREKAKPFARYTVFELRASCDGKQRQDVLPPSIHPGTGKPYRWLVEPCDNWPEPPRWLLTLWQEWDKLKPQLQEMCPWVEDEKAPEEPKGSTYRPERGSGDDVIGAYCRAHDLRKSLEAFGYERKGSKRYLSPHSGSGLPGVNLFAGENSAWIHHASDPLCSEESRHPVNAFDLYCYYDHKGDIRSAVKAAAELLGMKRKPVAPVPARTPPAPSVTGGVGAVPTLEIALERYWLVHGETTVWDSERQTVLKKLAFQELVGKEVYKAWSESPARKVFTPEPPAPQVSTKDLERYHLVHGDTKVWDSQKHELIKKTAFGDLVGKAGFKAWSEHPDRRVITKDQIAELQASENKVEKKILDRYRYIYPTKSAWDEKRKEIVPLDALKCAIPNEYEWWMHHPQRKSIVQDHLVFDPTQKVDPDTHVNMFTGLPMTPSGTPDKCASILELLFSLCNHDARAIAWVLKWMAYPLQHVGAKMDTALLFHSETQGSGKSLLFADIYSRIYGEYGSILGQHQLESQYTDWRSRLLYGVFEEVLSRNQKYSHTGTLKHMITGKTQRIEKKFISGWEEANHMNCVFLSNEFQPFPLEPSDRRFMVVWPENTLPDALMAKVGQEIDGEGVAAFYQYLMDYDLEDFTPRTKPLMNKAKERLIEFGLPSWEVFWREWTDNNLWVPFQTCLTSDLHRVYRKWCTRTGDHPMSLTKFATILSTRLTKKANAHYTLGVNRKQGTFLIAADRPANLANESTWLGQCVYDFREAMAAESDE